MNLLYIPAVLLMACFVLYPLARGIYISFFKWNGYSQNMTFIGLKNYLSLLSDKYFKSSFWNTMLYGFGSALLQNVFGLALALFLNSKFKIRNAVRTIIYLPVMISGLLMGYIMYFFFQLNHGVIRQFRYLHYSTPTCSQACLMAAPTSLPERFSPCAIVSFAKASKSASCARLRSQTVSYQA